MGRAIRRRPPEAANLLDPNFWSQEWERAVKVSSLAKKSVSPERWTDFWNQTSRSYLDRIQFESPLIEEVVRILLLEGVIDGECFVLDIGAGPGTFTLPIARSVRHVVALDPAAKMIETLQEAARAHGLSNITCLCQGWEESDFSREFDLVFASFSPAIRSAQSLSRMHRASRKSCCLITSSDEKTFQVRNELWERLFGEPFQSTSFHIVYPFNYLYACGFRPHVRFIEREVSYEEPLEVVLDRYERYFAMFVEMTPPRKEIIRRYFNELSCEGIVKTRESKGIALMWWNVER